MLEIREAELAEETRRRNALQLKASTTKASLDSIEEIHSKEVRRLESRIVELAKHIIELKDQSSQSIVMKVFSVMTNILVSFIALLQQLFLLPLIAVVLPLVVTLIFIFNLTFLIPFILILPLFSKCLILLLRYCQNHLKFLLKIGQKISSENNLLQEERRIYGYAERNNLSSIYPRDSGYFS